MKWIRYSQQLPMRYALKQDIPKPWHGLARKVEFLFEIAWVVRDENGLVYMDDGNWVPTLDFHLKTPGHVIGLRDLTSADAYDWAPEWRAAMNDRIHERLSIQ